METSLTTERRGFWSVLESPFVYEVFHHLIGARRWLKRFATDVIRARPGDHILDIGCGPGALLRYLPEVAYVGIDRNAACIRRAQQAYGGKGQFKCDDVVNFDASSMAPVDIAVAIGLLHHLDDATAARLLSAAAKILKPTGRLITADPCFHASQSPVIRFVVSHDRGRHVRQIERYRELVGSAFTNAKASLVTSHFPFPHAVCIIEGSRAGHDQTEVPMGNDDINAPKLRRLSR
jgi:SAM-dependent methyltransferase